MMRAGRSRVGARLGQAARVALLLSCIAAAGQPAMAADTDLVVLNNGDRLHGELKALQFGRLEFSTSSMGTVYVEWDKVVEVMSPSFFEVEMMDGTRYYGSFLVGGPGTLALALEGRTTPLPLALVVRIRPLKSSFWDRIDGSINLGASYTKSSEIGQGSLSVAIGTRRPKYEFSTEFDTTITIQPDEPDKSRTVGSVNYLRLLRNRWYVPATVKLERNTDLGLDLRSSVGAGFGRYFVQTNRSILRAGAGIMLNEENPVEGESTANVEGFLGVSYSFFTYDTPKTDISTAFIMYPSLNVGGRYRTEFDLGLRREIVKDFTVGVTAYDSYDSKPPAGNSSSHDLGVTLSVGWTF